MINPKEIIKEVEDEALLSGTINQTFINKYIIQELALRLAVALEEIKILKKHTNDKI